MRRVGGADVVEHDVVVRPYLSDEQKGDGVGEIGRPECAEAVQQVCVVAWWLDLEDEQGDGDREDSIAERDQSRGLAVHGRRIGSCFAAGGSCGREPVRPADHRSSTTLSRGCEQQMSALPAAGGSTGSGL
jgi:hypothetical protein